MTEQERENLQGAAVFAGGIKVAGREMRPLRVGSYAALQMVGNPLVSGGDVGDPNEDHRALVAFLEFVWAHVAPVEEVARLACRPQEFREAALVLGTEVSFEELAELSEAFQQASAQMEAVATEVPGKPETTTLTG